jgi:flagellar hook-associated protein 1 FlgK
VSTFGALNTAYRGLSAAQQAMDLAGHNISNAGTEGYTRQRIEQSSVAAPAAMGLATTGPQVGQGVAVDRIARLGNALLDASARTTAATAGYTAQRSSAYQQIEAALQEPGTDGLSARLQSFWSAWQDVANQPGQPAPASALVQAGNQIASALSAGYGALDAQWSATRADAQSMVASLNDAAAQVAALNKSIRSTLGAGGSANELIDARATLTESIASLAGGTVREEADGTATVYLGGNALVSGDSARSVQLAGAATMADTASGAPTLVWADRPAQAVGLDGGSIAGALSVLGPANGGSGGAIAEAAAQYNAVAASLAASVNAVHSAGQTSTGARGGAFFALSASLPAAQGLTVAVTGADQIAAGAPGAGALDGSTADAIAQLGLAPGSPDAGWAAFVTATGSASRAAQQQGDLADTAAANAKQAQTSNASVSLDEENVNLLAAQHAYQSAARVLTAVDQALDTLINHTGTVGL